MAAYLFANFAASTLAAPISPSATSLTVAAGQGALFPNPSAGQQFALVLNDAATGLNFEIVLCTARASDVLTIARAQEGTTAQNWIAGDIAANLNTAATMAAMLQTATLSPSRIVTAYGAFTMTTADAGGAVGLNRSGSPSATTTTLPSGAQPGQTYAIEDLAGGANGFGSQNVVVSAPGGMTIAGLASVTLNVNRQCSQFRFYGSNLWSFKP